MPVQSPWRDLADLVGVPHDTAPRDVVAAVAEALEEVADPSTARAAAGVVQVEASVFAQLQHDAEHGRTAAAREASTRRLVAVDNAVTTGRITAGRRASWLAAIERNPDAVVDLHALPAGAAVPTAERGHAGTPETGELPDQWFAGVPSVGAGG